MYTPPPADKQFTLYAFRGIDNIILGESTLHDIQEQFGNKPIQKRWVPSDEAFMFGRFEKYIEYKELGLVFSALNLHDRNHGNKVWRIYADSTCNCITEKGIIIGSTIKDVFDNYEKLSLIYLNKTDSFEIWMEDSNHNNESFVFIGIKNENTLPNGKIAGFTLFKGL